MFVAFGIAVFLGCALQLGSGVPAACCINIGDYIADHADRCFLYRCVYGPRPGEIVHPLYTVKVPCPRNSQINDDTFRYGRHDIPSPCINAGRPCKRESPFGAPRCSPPNFKTHCYDCTYDEASKFPFTACKEIDTLGGLVAKPMCRNGVCFVRRKEGPDGKNVIRRGCANDYPRVKAGVNCVIPPSDRENRMWTFCSGDLCNDQSYRTVTEGGQKIEKDPVEYECGL